MNHQTINISLPKELVKKIDEQAKKDYSSRSDYIRKSLVASLRIDEASGISAEALEVAQSITRRYEQDFKNLADR